MGKPEVKGTVTPLSSMFPAEEAQKAAKRVEETLSENQIEMNQLREFIADNTSLINLVQKLPDELHHDIMVPFGKAAFFPGRLIHTNEFLVLLGENYYAERTVKQTVEILNRRGKSLESKVDSLKAVMQDLRAEVSFFDSTASEVAEGLVEIREEYEEENSSETVSQSGQLEQQKSPSFAEADNKMGASEDDEFARIMSRLEELEKEELAAESYGENDEDQDANAAESDGDEKEKNKAAFHREKDEAYISLDHNQIYSECTGLTVEPVTKGRMSHTQSMPQDTKMIGPSINASVPFEKKVKFEEEHSSRIEKSVQTSKSEFDSSKAFTGSIVEHTQNLEKNLQGQTTTQQVSGSQPSKPVSRFKMQRK
ncbi:hypothetical protein DITRI_Ditri01bG0123100 [Diplodiscus trichospermus]